jgi:hypothetical protein
MEAPAIAGNRHHQSKKAKAVLPELLARFPEIRLKEFRASTGDGCSLGQE